jgi:hypothetical protein
MDAWCADGRPAEIGSMMICYPCAVAVLQAIGQVGMRAVAGMLMHGNASTSTSTSTSQEGAQSQPPSYEESAFWLAVLVLCVDGYLVTLYLAKTYSRFESVDCW